MESTNNCPNYWFRAYRYVIDVVPSRQVSLGPNTQINLVLLNACNIYTEDQSFTVIDNFEIPFMSSMSHSNKMSMNVTTGPATEALERFLSKGMSSCKAVPPTAFQSGQISHLIPHSLLDLEWQDSFPVISWSDEILDETAICPQTFNSLKRKNSSEERKRGLVRSQAFRERLSQLNCKQASLSQTLPFVFEAISKMDDETSVTFVLKSLLHSSPRNSSRRLPQGSNTMMIE